MESSLWRLYILPPFSLGHVWHVHTEQLMQLKSKFSYVFLFNYPHFSISNPVSQVSKPTWCYASIFLTLFSKSVISGWFFCLIIWLIIHPVPNLSCSSLLSRRMPCWSSPYPRMQLDVHTCTWSPNPTWTNQHLPIHIIFIPQSYHPTLVVLLHEAWTSTSMFLYLVSHLALFTKQIQNWVVQQWVRNRKTPWKYWNP